MENLPKEIIIIIIALIIFFLSSFSITWFAASQEANTFNKFSDKDATAWDAMWAELRVEACN